jgi:hypothetical protein
MVNHFEKKKQNIRNGCIWLRTGTGGGLFQHGNEPYSSIKGREFLD